MAQVEFPEGINLFEKEPGLDISYNFLAISSSDCAAQKFKQRTTEETHCWPDCQQVPSMSSFSVFSVFPSAEFTFLGNRESEGEGLGYVVPCIEALC